MPPSCDQWIVLLEPQRVVQGRPEMELFQASVVKVVGLNRNPVVQHNWELLLQSSVEKISSIQDTWIYTSQRLQLLIHLSSSVSVLWKYVHLMRKIGL